MKAFFFLYVAGVGVVGATDRPTDPQVSLPSPLLCCSLHPSCRAVTAPPSLEEPLPCTFYYRPGRRGEWEKALSERFLHPAAQSVSCCLAACAEKKWEESELRCSEEETGK